MALNPIDLSLRRHRRVSLDSSVFIYQLEANPRYIDLTDSVFAWLEKPGHSAVTSTITMTELLVLPYRNRDERKANEFFSLLSGYPQLEWIAPDLAAADIAARVRAFYGLRTPDAMQAACTIQSGATAFFTNDKTFRRVKEFETFLLDDLRPPQAGAP